MEMNMSSEGEFQDKMNTSNAAESQASKNRKFNLKIKGSNRSENGYNDPYNDFDYLKRE